MFWSSIADSSHSGTSSRDLVCVRERFPGYHIGGGGLQQTTDAQHARIVYPLHALAGKRSGSRTAACRQPTEHDRCHLDGRHIALVCDHYKRQLAATDYVGGCPIGAAAQEAFADPKLGPVVASTVDAWTGALADVLIRSGHDEDEAANLAMLCISALEGAITMSRVTRSTAPIDTVLARIAPMLVVRRP